MCFQTFDSFRIIKVRPDSVKTFEEIIMENGENEIREVKNTCELHMNYTNP